MGRKGLGEHVTDLAGPAAVMLDDVIDEFRHA
jgi:hypothetical protein